MTAAEMYRAMCQFAHDQGWERVSPKEGGWWFHADSNSDDAMTIGELLEEELQRAGIDLRQAPKVVIEVDAPGGAGGAGTDD